MPAEFSPGGLEDLRAFLNSPRALMDRIGVEMASRTQESFDRGGHGWRGGEDWPDRRVPNSMGILADMKNSSSLKPDRMRAGPVLQDTGRLMGSISHRVVSDSEVEYGTNVSYASNHQLGTPSTLIITKGMKQNLADLLEQNPDLREELGWAFSKDSVTSRPRVRLVVTYEDGDTQAIQDVVDDFVREFFR